MRFSDSFTSASLLCEVDNVQSLVQIVDTLRRLRRIVQLTLDPVVLQQAFETEKLPPALDEDPYDDSNSPLHRSWKAFSEVLVRMKRVNIQDIRSMTIIVPIVSLCRNLEVLNLRGPSLDLAGPGGDPPLELCFAEGVGTWTSLRSLRLNDSAINGTLDLSPLLPPNTLGRPFPPLESLTLCADSFHSSWLDFASIFSTSLLDLSFEAEDDEIDHFRPSPGQLFDLSATSFPRLKRLRVFSFRSISSPIILSAKQRNFPVLKELDIGVHYFDHKLTTELQLPTYPVLLTHAKGLLRGKGYIRIFDKFWTFRSGMIRRATKLGIDTRPTAAFPSEGLLEEDEEDHEKMRNDLPKSVIRVVDYLAQTVKRLKSDGKSARSEWQRLAKVLREAELERTAMQC